MYIKNIVKKQREFYLEQKTLTYSFRKEALNTLRKGMMKYQTELESAMKQDLGKSALESYMSEIGIVLRDISYIGKRLKRYMKNKRVGTSILDFPAIRYFRWYVLYWCPGG